MSEPPIRDDSRQKAVVDTRLETAPDTVGTAPAVAPVHWNLMLVWFLRIMAVLWMAKGLFAWADILGFIPEASPFDARPVGAQATLIYFAVLDLVAAVGLWLTSTWGGVMWLLAVMSHLILTIFFPRIVVGNVTTVGFLGVLIASYLLISWRAAHDES